MFDDIPFSQLKGMENLSLDDALWHEDDETKRRRLFPTKKEQDKEIKVKAQVRLMLLTLNPRQRKVLYHKYFLGEKEETIAKLMGVSQARVSELLLKAVRNLKKRFFNESLVKRL